MLMLTKGIHCLFSICCRDEGRKQESKRRTDTHSRESAQKRSTLEGSEPLSRAVTEKKGTQNSRAKSWPKFKNCIKQKKEEIRCQEDTFRKERKKTPSHSLPQKEDLLL